MIKLINIHSELTKLGETYPSGFTDFVTKASIRIKIMFQIKDKVDQKLENLIYVYG